MKVITICKKHLRIKRGKSWVKKFDFIKEIVRLDVNTIIVQYAPCDECDYEKLAARR